MEGDKVDGNWKSYSNLTEKYNSSFIILDTGHWDWHIMN